MKESVEYLGHKVDATGLHTTESKVEALLAGRQNQIMRRSYGLS